MNITHSVITRRRVHAQYEHTEITIHAELSLDIDAQSQLNKLYEMAEETLYPERVTTKETVTHTVTLSESPKATANFVKDEGEAAPVVGTEKKSAPKTRKATAEKEVAAKDTLENGQDIPPVIPEEAAKVETTVSKQSDSSDGAGVQSKGTKVSASVDKNVVKYDATIKEHRSRFATYLNTNHKGWTPNEKFGTADSPAKAKYAADVTAFSKELNGIAFEDSQGNMLDSSKEKLKSFFG